MLGPPHTRDEHTLCFPPTSLLGLFELPRSCLSVMPSARVSLNFVIVGGSVAGLSAALALQTAGHSTLVLEAAEGRRAGNGPCRSPPNMTKLLDYWGIGQDLRQRCVTTTAIQFRDGDSSEILGVQKLIAPVMNQFGSDFLSYKHSDLYDVLHDYAEKAGVKIRSQARVAHVDPLTPSLRLESGEVIYADIVIGADGYSSLVRDCVVGKVEPRRIDERHVYNFTIPLETIREDPELRHLADTKDWQIWMGDNCCLQGYSSPMSNEYMVLLKTPAANEGCVCAPWDSPKPMSTMVVDLSGFGPQAQKVASFASKASRTVNLIYDPFDQWVHEDSKVVLVGDAAHPQVPSGSQASAMAIEDAATLGALFTDLKDTNVVPVLLSAYEDIRQQRCADVADNERSRTDFVSLPRDDPSRTARNEGFKEAMAHDVLELEDAEEEVVANNLGDYVMLWAHDAYEAVDDWRTKWGAALQSVARGDACLARSVAVHLEVIQESKAAHIDLAY